MRSEVAQTRQLSHRVLSVCSLGWIYIAIIVWLVAVSSAQVDRSGLTGTVIDPSGRVLPQTHVAATLNSTGLQRVFFFKQKTAYEIPELPVGVYTVTFEHDGF